MDSFLANEDDDACCCEEQFVVYSNLELQDK